MTRQIVAISTRPSLNSKTSRVLRRIGSLLGTKHVPCEPEELSDFDVGLRSASCRVQLPEESAAFLDRVEHADGLVIGVSMKSPAGYPALLRHLFEMADPSCLREKPVAVLKAHCNTPEQTRWETEFDLFIANFGFQQVAALRLSSKEMLAGIDLTDTRLRRLVEKIQPRSTKLVAVS